MNSCWIYVDVFTSAVPKYPSLSCVTRHWSWSPFFFLSLPRNCISSLSFSFSRVNVHVWTRENEIQATGYTRHDCGLFNQIFSDWKWFSSPSNSCASWEWYCRVFWSSELAISNSESREFYNASLPAIGIGGFFCIYFVLRFSYLEVIDSVFAYSVERFPALSAICVMLFKDFLIWCFLLRKINKCIQ